jgi:hypothetical protein
MCVFNSLRAFDESVCPAFAQRLPKASLELAGQFYARSSFEGREVFGATRDEVLENTVQHDVSFNLENTVSDARNKHGPSRWS